MSDSFDPYVAWLDFTEHDQPPGYYGLLKLAPFESDLDRIQQAIFHESMNVSNFLRGPHRELAEAVLEELNRAESCLTNPRSKAEYDERLGGSLKDFDDGLDPLDDAPGPEEEPVQLVEVAKAAANVPAPISDPLPAAPAASYHAPAPLAAPAAEHAPRHRAPAGKSAHDASEVADRSVWAAIENARRRTSEESRKKGPAPQLQPSPVPQAAKPAEPPKGPTPSSQPGQTISLSSGLAQAIVASIPAPLVKHRLSIAAGVLVLIGGWFVVQFASAALHKPLPPRPPIVWLDPDEKLLAGQQMIILSDTVKQDAAARQAAAEKLQTLSAATLKHYEHRFKDLADKQPEESLQQMVRSLAPSGS